MTDNEALVERAQMGDHDAFAQLLDLHLPHLHRVAAALVGVQEAADVVQEGMVKAWVELPRLRNRHTFAGWARAIVANTARNTLRTRSRRIQTQALDEQIGLPVDPTSDFSRDVDARMHVDAMFLALPLNQRLVLSLFYGADLTIDHTAHALGIPVGTAKSRLNAGLRRLRQGMASDTRMMR